jgi:protein tyrosine phosphatase (PTP) superfamily phosphohydrolase (DUF442 family)
MASTSAARPAGKRRWLRPVLVLVVLVALIPAGRWAHWRYVQHRFRIITEGAVYQSAQMPMDDLLDTVRARGIQTVIDFREEPQGDLDAERATLEEAGVRYVNLPSPQVPVNATVDAYLDLLQDESAFPILVHCEHGEGRSVLFAALYRIEFEGWEPERARESTRILSWRGSFAPGSSKGDFLSNYRPRLPAPATRDQ